jgi:hypothetical protein
MLGSNRSLARYWQVEVAGQNLKIDPSMFAWASFEDARMRGEHSRKGRRDPRFSKERLEMRLNPNASHAFGAHPE